MTIVTKCASHEIWRLPGSTSFNGQHGQRVSRKQQGRRHAAKSHMMLHNKSDARKLQPERGLMPLILRCSHIDDLQRFALLASRISVVTSIIYRRWSDDCPASHTTIEVDIGSLSLDQAVMEAEFANIVVADLSRFNAIEVCGRNRTAVVGPAVSLSRLIDHCRPAQLLPKLTATAFESDLTLPFGSQMDKPPCRISRVQRVHVGGEIDWAPTWDLAMATGWGSAPIHRLEIPLHPV
ncbi:MAG: hypothetical protein ACK4N1_16955 [Pseudorhizobium sp.]